jgi:hypothetical protein
VAVEWSNETLQKRRDVRKTRIFYPDGRVVPYDDQRLAFSVWIDLPKGTRAAIRSPNDATPVHSCDYIDKV